jgi:hypothetical protein
MNHPTPDQWMSFLYGEDSEQIHCDLDAHLRGCGDCAAKLKSLRAATSALDEWRLPRTPAARPRPVLRWAAAAVLLLAAGIGIGRFSAGNTESMRASMQLEMDTKLAAAKAETQQLLAGFIKDLEQGRAADAGAFLVALKQMDARRGSETARLRRDLDTVAVFADARLSEAQEQLYQLATFAPPAGAVQPDEK